MKLELILKSRPGNQLLKLSDPHPLHIGGQHAFDFGGPQSLPNVFVPMPGGQIGPAFIPDGLRALEWDAPPLQHSAEYRPQELIMWLVD